MPNLTCMTCRTRFHSPSGREPACPVCGPGSHVELEDPKAGNAPTQVRAMAIGDAILSAIIVGVGIVMILVGLNPEATMWADMGLAEMVPVEAGQPPKDGMGATEWHPGVLFGVGGFLMAWFIFRAVVVAKYMKERNWARITRVVIGVLETLGFTYLTYYAVTDGKGLVGEGESAALLVMMAAFSLFSLFAMNQASTWEWFHPDAEPDRR